MNMELYLEISQFLYQEAYLLDHRKYKEWLDLLTEDIVYRMPMRLTKERKDGQDITDEMTFFEEDKKSLSLRVERLYTKFAWVEDPPPRQRHLIGNILIESNPRPDEYVVRSAFNFYRSVGSDWQTEHISGEREDLLRKENGVWKIASRTIYPDQAILNVRNLSMFL